MARKLNRTKKNSILNFIAVAFVTVLGLVLTFCSFMIPFSPTGKTFKGFAGSVSVGVDLAGGVSVVYDCERADGCTLSMDNAIDQTTDRLIKLLNREYSETNVTRLGDSQIRVEVSGAKESDTVFSNIGKGQTLYLTYEENGKTYVDGSVDIKEMYASYQSYWGVVIEFTEQGQQHFAELTELAANSEGKKVYFYLGDTSGKYLTYMGCESKLDQASTFIGNKDWDKDNANNYIYQIVGGTFPTTIALNEISPISARLGDNTLLLTVIGIAVALLLVMVFMGVRYGMLGLIADFALVVYTVLLVFFMQAVTPIILSISGIAAILLSYFVVVDTMIYTFERIRRDYRAGKKMPLAVKGGFNATFWTVFDTTVVGVILSVVLCIIGNSAMISFGLIMIIGLLLSLFINQALLRGFAKWYLAINSTKPNALRLPKQVKPVKETNEIVIEGGDING